LSPLYDLLLVLNNEHHSYLILEVPDYSQKKDFRGKCYNKNSMSFAPTTGYSRVFWAAKNSRGVGKALLIGETLKNGGG
jgi:hypothetical protein